MVFKASWCSPWLRNWIYRINKRKSNRIAIQNKPMKRYVMYTEIEKKVWRHFSWNDLYIHPVLEGLFLIQVWSHQPRQGGHGDLLHGPRLQQRLRSDEAQAQQVHGPWGLQHELDVRQHHVKKSNGFQFWILARSYQSFVLRVFWEIFNILYKKVYGYGLSVWLIMYYPILYFLVLVFPHCKSVTIWSW